MHDAAAGAQPQRGAPAVAAVGGALDQAALHQSGDGPADRDLVHDDPLPDLGGREGGEAAQRRHHPPLGDRQAEGRGIEIVQRFGNQLRQHRQPVGQKILQLEGLQSGGHNSYI